MTPLLGNVLAATANLAAHDIVLSYALFCISVILLGNIGAFAGLWLAFHGDLGPSGIPVTIGLLVLSDVVADLLWYSMGRGLSGTKFGLFIERRLPGAKKIQDYLNRRGVRLIFLAKFLYASNFIILFSVGWIKMDFKKYIRASMLAVILWVPVVTLLAFVLFVSLNLVRAATLVKHLEVMFLVGLVLFIILNKVIKFIIKKNLSKHGEPGI